MRRHRRYRAGVVRGLAAGLLSLGLGFLAAPVWGADGRVLPSKRVTLDVQRADIHNVLRLLAEDAGINLILDDKVQGQVTLRLRNVRWDHALKVVLQSKNLGSVWDGEILRVAPQADLAAEREQVVKARDLWLHSAPLKTWIIPVNNARADDLLPHVQATLSPRGSASVDVRTNVIIIHDVDPRDR
ncbi:MAG: pilus assembly protein PilQ [Pseudomonadota bacterium]